MLWHGATVWLSDPTQMTTKKIHVLLPKELGCEQEEAIPLAQAWPSSGRGWVSDGAFERPSGGNLACMFCDSGLASRFAFSPLARTLSLSQV